MPDLPSSGLVYQVDRIEPKQPVSFKTKRGYSDYESTNTNFRYLRAEAVGSYIYVFGELRRTRSVNGANAEKVTVAVLDVVKSSWRWLVLQGPGTEGASTFLYQDCIYWYGSTWNATLRQIECVLFKLDLVSEEYKQVIQRGVTPKSRTFATTVYFERRKQMVLFGGTASNYKKVNDVLVLNMPEKVWSIPEIKGVKPSPRCKHAACNYGEVMYVYGGLLYTGFLDHGMYLLHFETGNSARWSRPKTNAHLFGRLYAFSMLPIGKMLLLCNGKYRQHSIYCFDTTRNLFMNAESNITSKEIDLGHAAVSWDNGKSIMVLGGASNRLNRYHQVYAAK